MYQNVTASKGPSQNGAFFLGGLLNTSFHLVQLVFVK